ncbi:hypothetical protein KAFR_0A05240 [Kazachstania africana CBS 2517]|uniref:RING-type E3 ubiquitin transferase n=1 Tax=Kazachstania africana (strain ATCC 22294 / BCRC 22015 / CBS 2517 / CECT 1963 / NBRC 1671 / NRRL Y-8276) TaxID=1071382 RepID=H2ANK9_KAZAF|nr:hypothetical protein KAFR_0A05240 [Kazachstania africana CBS 2517]CCF55959.1 hypothetical protein KAFR_0A05240 [Kazachstania africana CBS 2517]
MIVQSRKQQLVIFSMIIYLLTIITIFTSYKSSKTFLQCTIKLTQGINVLILAIFTALNLFLLWEFLRWILFGELRLIEHEHIFERLPFTIINVLFMISIFNEYQFFNALVFALILSVLKVFHWILKDRLESLLQSINDATDLKNLIFSRYMLNLAIFSVLDFWICSNTYRAFRGYDNNNSTNNNQNADSSNLMNKNNLTPTNKKALFLLFGMEFFVLFLDLINLAMHTVLNFYEFYCSQRATAHHNVNAGTDEESEEEADGDDDDANFNGLEGKFMYEKLIDVSTKFFKTIVHIFVLIQTKLQIMVLKDVVWDCLTLYQDSISLWKIYKNNKQLDDKLPTLSVNDVENDNDNICIVCMDDLVPSLHGKEAVEMTQADIDSISKSKRPKKLPCGHMLHLSCLKNWMERSQTCPICRLPVFDENGNVKPFLHTTTNNNMQPNNDADVTSTTATNSRTDTSTPMTDVPTPTRTSASALTTSSIITQDFKNGITPIDSVEWYAFEIDSISDARNEVKFNVRNASSNNRSIPMKLLIERMEETAEGQIVIPDSAFSRE